MWIVPLGSVLTAQGAGHLVPWAFSLGPLAAMVSPLLVGALADRRFQAQHLLSLFCLVSAAFLFLAFHGLGQGWGGTMFLALLAAHQLCFVPTWSLVSSIILTHAPNPPRNFPLLRVWATLAWIVSGLAVSFCLRADTTTRAGLVASVLLATAGLYALSLPSTPPTAPSLAASGWRQLLGWDALDAFPKGNLRVFLVAHGLLSVPLAAFFPYAPQFLRVLGHGKTTALMSSGQVAETLSMIMLGWFLLRWPLKRILALGLGFATLRYACLAAGALHPWTPLVVTGLTMHGLIYTFFFVTAQVFVEKEVDRKWRARVQALLTTVSSGLGSLVGVLAAGLWFSLTVASSPADPVRWSWFWGGLALVAALVAGYFLTFYHGRNEKK